MKKDELLNSNYIINNNSLVRDVLVSITDNQRGSIVVVDDDMRLVGVISDGDLRRAFLRGATLDTRIEGIVNMRPLILEKNSRIKPEEIFNNDFAVTLLPIVDSNNVVVDVAVRNPNIRKDI